jgi:radical SAM superfamily enzyme YgiQ (UPF0313 family)
MKKDLGICLIIPPSAFLLDERVFMTLGILRVAAVLEKQCLVEVLDLSGIENYEDAVADYVRSSPVRMFGITGTTPQIPAVSRITDVIRRQSPESRVILGGPHATLVHAAYRKEKLAGATGRATNAFAELENRFDVLVAGDGEKAIFRALGEHAPKLVDADDSKTDLFLINSDLDVLPWPARHLVDVNSYHYSIEGHRALSLISQLGCPFNCGFCGGRNSPFLRKIRTRSVQNVVAEIEHLHRTYGVTGFMFYDDELNVNKRLIVEMMNAIADLQGRLGVEFRLRGFIKSQLFTEDQAEAMHRAGFRWILVGFESGSPRILRNIEKRATREENTQCMEIAGKHGLKVKALMSLGHPGESAETIQETREWLLEVRPDDFDATIITVYPGTPYYDEAIPHPGRTGVWVYSHFGDRLYSQEVDYSAVAEYYKGDPNGGYTSFVSTDFLEPEEIVAMRDDLERNVRGKLGIPFNPANPGIRYEHSMGQGSLPPNILRRSI